MLNCVTQLCIMCTWYISIHIHIPDTNIVLEGYVFYYHIIFIKACSYLKWYLNIRSQTFNAMHVMLFLGLLWFRSMVFNATFNNVSVISLWSLLLVEETRGPGENHRPAASHWQTVWHNVVTSTHRHEGDSNPQHQWW